jgi:hypothetical protein
MTFARAKPGKTFPGSAALKLTRPSGSGDLTQNLAGHGIPGFVLEWLRGRMGITLAKSGHEKEFTGVCR